MESEIVDRSLDGSYGRRSGFSSDGISVSFQKRDQGTNSRLDAAKV